MLFGDGLPLSTRNISQVKRMAAKRIGHDRRKASSSSSAYTRVNTSNYRRFGNYGMSNLNFKRHYEYRKPPFQRSQSPKLRRAPVQRQNAYPQVDGMVVWHNFTVLGVILLLIAGFYKL